MTAASAPRSPDEKEKPPTLTDYVKAETLRLEDVLADDDVGTYESDFFSPDDFFKQVTAYRNKEKDKAAADQAVGVLDRYAPRIFQALERRGASFGQYQFYFYWMKFLVEEAMVLDKAKDVLLGYGEKIFAAHRQNQLNSYPCFHTLETFVNRAPSILSRHPEAGKPIARLLSEYAPEIIKAYAQMGQEGLDYELKDDEKDDEKKFPRSLSYKSYAQVAKKEYVATLALLEKVGRSNDIRAFINLTQPQLTQTISQSKTGYRRFLAKDDFSDRFFSAMPLAIDCHKEGAKALVAAYDGPNLKDITLQYAFEHMAPLAETALEQGDAVSYERIHREMYNAYPQLSGVRLDFHALFAPQVVKDLMHAGHGHMAMEYLQHVFHTLTLENQDMALASLDSGTGNIVGVVYDSGLRPIYSQQGYSEIALLFTDTANDAAQKKLYPPEYENPIVTRLMDMFLQNGSIGKACYESDGERPSAFESRDASEETGQIHANAARMARGLIDRGLPEEHQRLGKNLVMFQTKYVLGG